MFPIPAPTRVPTPSAIAAYLPGAYFHDAWVITAGEPDLSALGQFLKALQATPPWVNTQQWTGACHRHHSGSCAQLVRRPLHAPGDAHAPDHLQNRAQGRWPSLKGGLIPQIHGDSSKKGL